MQTPEDDFCVIETILVPEDTSKLLEIKRIMSKEDILSQ